MASGGDQRIENWFPKLKSADYLITSPADPAYNCIAWAAGKTDEWWEPIEAPGYFWPDRVALDDRIETLVHVFRLIGFEECETELPEDGYEKIALYGQNGAYEHAARQLPDGKWTSKLGYYQDIEHQSLDGLAGREYGAVVKILRRRV